jgi:hypothetical protein
VKGLYPPNITRESEDPEMEQWAYVATSALEAGHKAAITTQSRYQEAGEALIKAKAKCGHGNWLSWLKRYKISRTSALRAMRIASKCATVAHLDEAVEVLSSPEEESEKVKPADEPADKPPLCKRCRNVGTVQDCKACEEAAEAWRRSRRGTKDGRKANEQADPQEKASDDEETGTQVSPEDEYPPRLRPLFEKQQVFKKLSAYYKAGIPLAKALEQSEAYALAHNGQPRKENSAFLQEAAEELDAITPECVCPICKGVEASPDNDDGEDSCKKCRGKGYLTVEEVEEAK